MTIIKVYEERFQLSTLLRKWQFYKHTRTYTIRGYSLVVEHTLYADTVWLLNIPFKVD